MHVKQTKMIKRKIEILQRSSKTNVFSHFLLEMTMSTRWRIMAFGNSHFIKTGFGNKPWEM